MGVDVNKANRQAAQLQEYAGQLKNAKKNLESYKAELSLNWIGKETQYIFAAIDSSISKINAAITELESLQQDVKSTAAQIRKEEIAAEEAARKAREEAERRAREEAQRKAAVEAEARRRAAEAEAQRRAAEAEAQRRAAEAEAQRREAEAEAQRRAAEAEAQRQDATKINSSQQKTNNSSSKKNTSSSKKNSKKKNKNPFAWLFD